VAPQSETFLVVYLEVFPPVCKVIFQVESPEACPVGWEAGCLGDQVDPVPNNFHRTRVQDLGQCKGFLTNNIPLTRVMRHFNNLDRKAFPHQLEWDTQVQPRRSRCWLSRTDRWKHSRGGTPRRGNRGREVA